MVKKGQRFKLTIKLSNAEIYETIGTVGVIFNKTFCLDYQTRGGIGTSARFFIDSLRYVGNSPYSHILSDPDEA